MMRRYAVYLLLAVCCAAGTGAQHGEELPLPDVPPSLTDPVQRADYIMHHFWDRLAAADTLRRHNAGFMERNIVNFMSLFPHGTPDGCSRAIARLLAESASDTLSLQVAASIMERYLAGPGSPMRNETHYIMYLEELLRLPALPEEVRARQTHRLADAKKNRPGTIAADFAYIDRNGTRRTLHTTAPGQRLLLLFYDPECDRCNEALRQLRDTEMAVLAVYTEGDRTVWDGTKWTLPQRWTVGIDDTGIVDSGLYTLPELPALYELDGDKRVVHKTGL